MEYLIKTTLANRAGVIKALEHLGEVTDMWPDGTFSFWPDNEEGYDTMGEICEDLGIDNEVI